MLDGAALTSEGEVHAGENVLREVDGLRGLGDTPLLHHELLVHDVGMPVVHPGAQHRVGALQDRSEGHLGAGGEVAHGADVAGDVLGQADDLLGSIVTALRGSELSEDAGEHQHLLEVASLVGVDALAEGSSQEDDGMVLVVALAVAQDGVPWQLNRELGLSPTTADVCAGAVDEAAEVAPMLPRMHVVHFRVHVLVLLIYVGHLQTARELCEHLVGVLVSHRLKIGVLLHGDDAAEAVVGSPDLGQGWLLLPCNPAHTLHFVVALQGRVVEHHAGDGAVQRLQPHGGPSADLLPLFVGVLLEGTQFSTTRNALHVDHVSRGSSQLAPCGR